MGDVFLVVYDGKKLKTYGLDSLSADKPSPINEFKVKVERNFLFSSPDYHKVFCLGKKLEVLSIDPLSGDLSVRVKSFKDLCKEHDVYFEDKESIYSLSSSINGDNILAIVGGDGIVISESDVKVIKGIEYRVKYKTREYLGTEIDKWGAWRIKEKEVEHFYTEKAFIMDGCISPNGDYAVLYQQDSDLVFLTIYDLEKSKHIKIEEIKSPYMVLGFFSRGWLRRSNRAFLSLQDPESGKQHIYVYCPRTGKREDYETDEEISSYDFHPTEDKIVFSDIRNKLAVMSIEDKNIDIEKLQSFKHMITGTRWSPTGKYISVITEKKNIYIVEYGKELLGKVKGIVAVWYAAR